MDKEYKQLEFWGNIECAVNELMKYKEKGILACGEFNGVTLYSDTVTMDSAYLSIVGKTKSQFEKEQQEWRENYEREEKKFKESIPALTKEWISKSREILTEDKWEYWDEIVPIRLDDLYHGMELGCCLDIVKILNNNGTLEEAKNIINSQDHSGMSYGLVCSMVREFSDRGNEFMDYVR